MQKSDRYTEFDIIRTEIKDPLKLYQKIRTYYHDTALLESLGANDDETSRYTLMGVVPTKKLLCYDGDAWVFYIDENRKETVQWQDEIDQWVTLTGKQENSPLQLGAIGYIGYERKHDIERLKQRLQDDTGVADIYLVMYSLLYCYDKKNDKACWIKSKALSNRVFRDIVEKSENQHKSAMSDFFVYGDVERDFEKDQYLDIINKTIEYIKNGDIFQANITMRFQGRYEGDIFQLYQYLRVKTPNPFFCFFDFDFPVISTSPERFIKIQNGVIRSHPIKGTIKIETADAEKQKLELLNSEKNRAENTMITDLLRNDLGKVCQKKTVKVPFLCNIKQFNNLFHLESIVEGILKPNVKLSRVLEAVFPGGSITGAPKIRAMEIIEALELTQRRVYCGSLGFFGTRGYLDTAIAIRTIYFNKEKFYFHAGGGIVVDSQAESEYEELNTKIALIIEALGHFNILNEKRKNINEIDSRLLRLLDERFKLIREVGIIKKTYNIAYMQKIRVEEMLENRKKRGKNYNISPQLIEELFLLLIKYAMIEERKEHD